MSTDPNSGIAFIEMFDSANGQLSNGEQFSGVLIAPDEILTVAHGVTDGSGNIRNSGSAYLGYNGGSLTGGISIDKVHVVDNSHPSGIPEDGSHVASDFAVIHLSSPVTNATTFSLGVALGGSYDLSGYPAINKGAFTTVSGTYNYVDPGVLSGPSVVGTASADGVSGGPLSSTVNGISTVYGIAPAGDNQGHAICLGLSQPQIDQIKSWVYSDDQGETWGAAFAPTPTTQATGGTTSNNTGTTGQSNTGSASSTYVDPLDRLSQNLFADAPSVSGPRSVMMTDIATAIGTVRSEGFDGSDIPDAAYELSSVVGSTSSFPKRAVALMAGIMAGESRVAQKRMLGYIANVFGIDLGGKTFAQVAQAGYALDKSFGSTATSAPIASTGGDGWTAQTLGAVLDRPGLVGMAHGAVGVSSAAEMASLVAPRADQAAFHRIG